MKIAIYGGSFNPMHRGHEQIVDYVLKNFDIDKVIIVPVGIPSHRENNLKESSVRLNICKKIFEDNTKVEVSDIEIKSNEKSYTYDTLLKIIDLFGEENEYFEIIGEDSLKKIKTWKNYKGLLELIKFIVFRRKDIEESEVTEELLKCPNIIILNNKYYDFSSTDIRKKIKDGEDISDLVNEKVKEIIMKEYAD